MDSGIERLVVESAKQELRTLNDLEHDLTYEVEQAEQIIDRVRQRLQENLNTKLKLNGCLRAKSIDDYLKSMADKKAKMKQRIQMDRQYLQDKISGHERWSDRGIQQLKAQCLAIESSMSDIFNAPKAINLKNIELNDIPNLGSLQDKKDLNLRWPTQEEFQSMLLTQPLELKAVRTKGMRKGALFAIQLVFENGIESTWLDGGKKDDLDSSQTI